MKLGEGGFVTRTLAPCVWPDCSYHNQPELVPSSAAHDINLLASQQQVPSCITDLH
ncbi:hypothetical protein SCLCIDRAFT_922520 [Scleroderma citrinum Foug A]|uniref:Uncharacterized protein n=1 Tax=Scleroderma citrinum Foug A TaxID=1036808 RepID=A0A0C3A7M1_9AGAM|nr:hypothetical protein SCLCIDRAFT_922520 [Scleroderma citrinum Foug A]